MGDASSSAPMAANKPEAQEVPSNTNVTVDGKGGSGGGRGEGATEASNPATTGFPPPYQPPYAALNQQHMFPGPLDNAHAQAASSRHAPYNMTTMANALPQPGYQPLTYSTGHQHPHHHQRFGAEESPSSMVPQMPQYAGQHNMHAPLTGQGYYMPQQPQMASYYGTHQHQSPQNINMSPRHGGNYYATPIMMNQHQGAIAPGYYHQPQHYGSMGPSHHHGQMNPAQYLIPDISGRPAPPPAAADGKRGSVPIQGHGPCESNENSRGNRPGVVRGPPRKPRQSGHAIWIGNLPPQADLMALVHHICRETTGLESLFLISKSNCAFANFKDDQSCEAAQQKLHDSKFQSMRLVSRLRKNTVEGTTGQSVPTGPATTSTNPSTPSPQLDNDESPPRPESSSANGEKKNPPPTGPAATSTTEVRAASKLSSSGTQPTTQKDKFFILKSLTLEDLELSVRNGVWATQSHNEETLNKAFGLADNVYLVFSANKSGEYFGYAKMVSPINDDPAAAIQFAPKAQAVNEEDVPKAVPTEATDICPRGRIIDDSARGTIFWEVESEEGDGEGESEESEDSASNKSGQDDEGENQAWGKPFKLKWLSTSRLPFYRTRGLRNPWNSNREVKIARDGTELEPSVGKRLIGLFNKPVQSPALPPMMMRNDMMSAMAGFPPPQPMGPYRQ